MSCHQSAASTATYSALDQACQGGDVCRRGCNQAPAVPRNSQGVWVCCPGDHASGVLLGSSVGSRQRHRIRPLCAHAAHRLLHWPHCGPHLRRCGCFRRPRLPEVSPPTAVLYMHDCIQLGSAAETGPAAAVLQHLLTCLLLHTQDVPPPCMFRSWHAITQCCLCAYSFWCPFSLALLSSPRILSGSLLICLKRQVGYVVALVALECGQRVSSG